MKFSPKRFLSIFTGILVSALVVAIGAPLMASSPDIDYDGVSDQDELLQGLNPLDPDSDGDGVNDGVEIMLGKDPKRKDRP